jgi:hypothetical protein
MSKPGNTVEFSATLRPTAAMKIIEQEYGPDQDEISRLSQGGQMILKVLSMSEEEKVSIMKNAARGDLLVVWFAMLTNSERREFMKAAEKQIREDLAQSKDL